uniref:exo-alpha-sialidase n=1 Tax=Cyprinus carpio TaxID=7962 RepID=A0A8C1VRC7_CYPCA
MASKSHPEPLPARTTLFQQKDGKTYRIPALIYISDGQTFLAFAEERSTPCDSDAKVLVMKRRSLQNGSLQVISFFLNTSYIFINQARLCYVTSTDYGQNWSQLTDLTNQVIGDEICNWATFAVGPGHGIQMKSGRLIIPAYVYYIHCRCFPFNFLHKVRPHALSFYSDDCGVTWQMGEKIPMESCECEMAEIIDHTDQSHLYCNARSTCGHRVEALSESSGAAFDNPHVAKKLVEPRHGCQGSVLSFPVPEPSDEAEKNPNDCLIQSDTKTWLLYSHPTNKKKRKDLGVYLNKSPLKTSGWGQPWIVHKGPSGYSDLTQCEEQFACLMECGEKSETEEIAFAKGTSKHDGSVSIYISGNLENQ